MVVGIMMGMTWAEDREATAGVHLETEREHRGNTAHAPFLPTAPPSPFLTVLSPWDAQLVSLSP